MVLSMKKPPKARQATIAGKAIIERTKRLCAYFWKFSQSCDAFAIAVWNVLVGSRAISRNGMISGFCLMISGVNYVQK